jgi:hypothetical protein
MRVKPEVTPVLELSPQAYVEIRDLLLGGGYDYLVFPDFGSFQVDFPVILRNRERRTTV